MKNLFIIGNGFDIAHGLKTSYENFHQYLINEYPEANGESMILPYPNTNPDGSESFDDDEVVSFLLHIITEAEPLGDKWSDLETSLGLLDFDEIFDDYDDDYDEDEDYEWEQAYKNEDISGFIYYAAATIRDYFSEWINTLHIDHTVSLKNDFIKLIDSDKDYFLTFNYTDTLEKLYNVKNICHIHGKQGEKLLLGHGNNNSYYDDNMLKHVGSENNLQELQDLLRKDTESALKDNRVFFDSLSDVIKIFSYGFSFAVVDQIYLREICRLIDSEKVEWFLNDFDSASKRKEYEQTLRNCGFKGTINVYHIEK